MLSEWSECSEYSKYSENSEYSDCSEAFRPLWSLGFLLLYLWLFLSTTVVVLEFSHGGTGVFPWKYWHRNTGCFTSSAGMPRCGALLLPSG